MQATAVLRLSLGRHDGLDREGFWQRFWESSEGGRSSPRNPSESEALIFAEFGRRLEDLLASRDTRDIRGGSDWRVQIRVASIQYGSIELLLALIGGDELVSDAFWTVLEFYAPQAFNDTLGSQVHLNVRLRRRTAENGGGSKGPVQGKLKRLLAVSSAPLVAWVLVFLAVIYFQQLRLEALAKEIEGLRNNYTTLVGKVMEQNGALVSALMSKIGPLPSPSPTPAAGTTTSTPAPSPTPSPTTTPTPAPKQP